MKMKNQTHTKTQELLQNIEVDELRYQEKKLPELMVAKHREITPRDYNKEYLAMQHNRL